MRGFIEELRHRNVFRVAIAYIVAGWLLAQVADLAADAFKAPEWVMQMLIAHAWMKRYYYGPFEWAWRAATYMSADVPWRREERAS